MEYTYTEILDRDGVLQCINRSDGWSIPIDINNSDYQLYLNRDNPDYGNKL